MNDIHKRIEELEQIVRACSRLKLAMYDSDSEASWPEDADMLKKEYEERYGVYLGGGVDIAPF